MAIKNTDFSVKELHELFSRSEKIFFIGVGGISMSAMAEFCAILGKEVYGYDRVRTPQAVRLEKIGKIKYSSTPDNVKGMDMVVYTNAINEKNSEYRQSLRQKIPLVSRGNFLGYLISLHKKGIGVCGMHGKSTTTALLAHIFYEAGENPTVFCGGEMKNFDSNFRFGGRGCCIFEACEYQNSFLKLPSTSVAVLNIDYDHPDFFNSLEDAKESFKRYIQGAALVFLNCDDENAKELSHKNAITFGFDKRAAYRAELCQDSPDKKELGISEAYPKSQDSTQIHQKNDEAGGKKGKTVFRVYKKGELLCTATIPFCGLYMVYDSLCAIAIAHTNGLPIQKIVKALSTFKGTKRRMEYLKKSDTGADIFEDYAHHPTEIKASISSLLEMGYERILCVFQAHTFSRTHFLYDRFTTAFEGVQELIVAPTFSAREENIFELSEEKFALDCGGEFISDFCKIRHRVAKSHCDCIVLMGAGDLAERLCP